jgi:urease accessory protein
VLRFVRAGERTVVHTARARSPLKLLLPKNHGGGAWVYAATLGGGLVDGDAVDLAVEVDRGACALLATQASTKVYRSPSGTAQRLRARVGSGALLAVLPDPVSCFAGARYEQHIDIDLEDDDSTLVLVDALTCGRASRGERWAFSRYASRTRVSRAGRLLVLDATLLDPRHGDLPARMGRFDALATVVAVGPRSQEVRARVLAAAATAPAKGSSPLTSATALGPDAALGRLAASSAQEAIAAIRALVGPVARELGDDPFARRW